MKVLIYGATGIGYIVASRLYQEHDIILMDEQERLPDRFSGLDIGYVCGSGADIGALCC